MGLIQAFYVNIYFSACYVFLHAEFIFNKTNKYKSKWFLISYDKNGFCALYIHMYDFYGFIQYTILKP